MPDIGKLESYLARVLDSAEEAKKLLYPGVDHERRDRLASLARRMDYFAQQFTHELDAWVKPTTYDPFRHPQDEHPAPVPPSRDE